METFILIIILHHYEAAGAASAEFNDLKSCQAAASLIIKAERTFKVFCVRKGNRYDR